MPYRLAAKSLLSLLALLLSEVAVVTSPTFVVFDEVMATPANGQERGVVQVVASVAPIFVMAVGGFGFPAHFTDWPF